MIRAALLTFLLAPAVCAQPVPRAGERVGAYLDRWDAWVETIPEDQRALPLIERVDVRMDQAIAESDEWRYWASTPPDPGADEDDRANWDWTTEFIESNPDVMELIRSYASMPAVGASLRDASFEHWFRPRPTYVLKIQPEPYALTDIAPQYRGSLRAHAFLLGAEMYLALERGDDERLLEVLRTLHDFARLSRVTSAWLDRLIIQACANMMASRYSIPAIDWSGIDTETMLSMIDILHATDQLLPADEALATERIVALELIDWFADDRDGDRFGPRGVVRFIDLESGPIIPIGLDTAPEHDGISERIGAMLGAVLLQDMLAPITEQAFHMNAYFDAAIKLCGMDHSSMRAFPEPYLWITSDRAEEVVPYAIAQYAVQARDLEFNLILKDAFHNTAALRLCAEIYRRRHGEYPAGVEDLDDDLLRFDFTDPFSGNPLRLRVSDGSLTIYSVGPDRADDQGSPLLSEAGMPVRYPAFIPLGDLEAMSESKRESIDGDWILYPPVD